LTGELAQIEQDIDDGRASAASLVRLFNAATEAEQRRDVDALTRACVLAKQLIEVPATASLPTRSACSTTARTCSPTSTRPPRRNPDRMPRRAPARARTRRQPRPLPRLRRTADLAKLGGVGRRTPPRERARRDPRRSTVAALSSGRTRLALPTGRPKSERHAVSSPSTYHSKDLTGRLWSGRPAAAHDDRFPA
jgi:hypothetical protein